MSGKRKPSGRFFAYLGSFSGFGLAKTAWYADFLILVRLDSRSTWALSRSPSGIVNCSRIFELPGLISSRSASMAFICVFMRYLPACTVVARSSPRHSAIPGLPRLDDVLVDQDSADHVEGRASGDIDEDLGVARSGIVRDLRRKWTGRCWLLSQTK